MTNKQYQERLEDALFSQGANSMKDHTHVWRGMVSDRTREGCVECRIKRVKPISPTENTEELDAIIKKLMIDSAKDIHNREKHGAKADFRYAHEARAALMALIASSNHQAAQAFGEKLHNKYRDIDGDCGYCDGTAYSAQHDELTSLMDELVSKKPEKANTSPEHANSVDMSYNKLALEYAVRLANQDQKVLALEAENAALRAKIKEAQND